MAIPAGGYCRASYYLKSEPRLHLGGTTTESTVAACTCFLTSLNLPVLHSAASLQIPRGLYLAAATQSLCLPHPSRLSPLLTPFNYIKLHFSLLHFSHMLHTLYWPSFSLAYALQLLFHVGQPSRKRY